MTNARYLWIMTDYGYDWPTTDRRYAPKWYPGDAWVDDMGIDAYNWYGCRAGIATPWKSLAVIIESFRRFGAMHPSKRLWLTEWASARKIRKTQAASRNGSPTRKLSSSSLATRSSTASPRSTTSTRRIRTATGTSIRRPRASMRCARWALTRSMRAACRHSPSRRRRPSGWWTSRAGR